MSTPRHFSDWSSLSTSDRPAAIVQARRRFESIGRRLHAAVDAIDLTYRSDGPLGGMPYVAKDMIATGVTAASWGCARPIEPVGRPAELVDRLTDAGGCLIGTAEMTELAYEPSGYNAARGRVLNPWNDSLVAGGSSSGSAALVASGCCFAALGSDTGGSVRIPAHCCGVTSLKPTWGTLPLGGTMPLAPSLDTIGVFARSAEDLGLVWDELGHRTTVLPETISAVTLDDAFAEADPEIGAICRDAIPLFGTSAVGRSGLPEDADLNALLVLQAEAARTHAARFEDVRVDATLRKRLAKGLTISGDELAFAVSGRAAAREAFLATVLRGADVVLLPVSPIKTPYVIETDPASPTFRARTLYALSRFTRFVNYLGLPALALPVGFDGRGMPVGLQIVGRPDNEALLIALAKTFQSKTDWHGRVPSFVAADIIAEKGYAA